MTGMYGGGRRLVRTATVALVAWSCGGGDTDSVTPPPPPPTVAAVEVSPATATIDVAATLQLNAVARASDGTTLPRTFTWSSSDPTSASVSGSGLVTAVAPSDNIAISASVEGKSGSASLSVRLAPVSSVSTSLGATTLQPGQTTQATVVLKDAAGNTLTGRQVTWVSSNAAVATVNGGGLVIAVAAGQAQITATSEGKSAAVTLTVVPPPLPSTTNVLVDLSHEFTFLYDIFAGHAPYWDAKFRRTPNHANLASASVDLDRYDIVIINQEQTGVAFGEDEMQRLQRWVHDGGGRLVLVARGTANLPLAQLAARFSIAFAGTTAAMPYEVKTHPATSRVSGFVAAHGAPPGTVVTSSSACDALVTDATQRTVVIACPWGAGRVVAISEPAFIANPYVQEITNVQFTKQLMAWLGPRNRAGATVLSRIVPDLEKPLFGGAKLLYTARTANSRFVSIVEAQHAQIDQELQRITGLQNVFQMTFLALPCGGGGYSGGAEVGVCGFGDAGYMTLVFAHELMHSFDNPNAPPEMMHPVVSYVATKVGAVLGGSASTAAASEKQAWDVGFKAADPTGTTLDVTNDALFDRRGKMYWIVGRLDGTYPFATTNLYAFPPAARDPGNFLKRYYQRKRADIGYSATPTNVVRLLSIAACRDLFPDFRAVGTTLGPTPAGLATEIAAACP